jgi:hypothetical protein
MDEFGLIKQSEICQAQKLIEGENKIVVTVG